MDPVHWHEMLTFSVSPLELFIRGTVIYLTILVFMRVFRREPGVVGTADLLMIVLIADASQNAMTAQYKSLVDGLVLISTLFFWNYSLDWLGYRFAAVERFIHPGPIPLIRNGRMLRQSMRRQLITEDQLNSILREHGVERAADVRSAHLEGNGRISILTYEGDENEDQEEDRQKPG